MNQRELKMICAIYLVTILRIVPEQMRMKNLQSDHKTADKDGRQFGTETT